MREVTEINLGPPLTITSSLLHLEMIEKTGSNARSSGVYIHGSSRASISASRGYFDAAAISLGD